MGYGGEMMAREASEGHVTVCTATDCRYNEETRCMAQGVMVNFHKDHADCNTYTQNEHVPGRTPDTSGMM